MKRRILVAAISIAVMVYIAVLFTDPAAAHMAVIADRIRRELRRPVGINVLANAAIPALAVASAAGAAFIRVNQWANAYVANEGFVEGEAARAMRYRAALRAGCVAIFADAHVKHGAHAIVADRPVEEQVRDLAFFDADVVIATGDLRAIPRALRLGRATLTAIRQNLFWAFAYNTLGIPLAALGFFGQYGPLIAALAMSLSSVTVIARSSLLAGIDLDR